jgi:hypothetical protein
MRGVDDALSAFSATRGLQVSIMMSFSKVRHPPCLHCLHLLSGAYGAGTWRAAKIPVA